VGQIRKNKMCLANGGHHGDFGNCTATASWCELAWVNILFGNLSLAGIHHVLIIKQITCKITRIFTRSDCFFNDLINVSQTRLHVSSNHDGKHCAIRSRVGINWQILIKKRHFKIIVPIKSLPTNYIIQCRVGGGFFLSNERAGTPCTQMAGSPAGVHTLSGNLVPRSSSWATRHFPRWAVTLTTIIYWPGDPPIHFWEVTGGVTAFITHGAVTGITLYIHWCRIKQTVLNWSSQT